MLREKSPFEYGERLIVCNCGQIVGGPDGGPGFCARCKRTVFFRARNAFLGQPRLRVPGPQIAPLRKREDEPRALPSRIASLWEGGGSIPAHRLGEALSLWQQARGRATDDAESSRELFLLTLELANHAYERDPYRSRALVERALEAVPIPRYRDALLGAMVRMAVRACDLRAAERWLQHILPSEELASDSEWRVSAAAVAILRKAPEAVLSALGDTPDAIIMDDSLTATAAVFRAHALEKTDRTHAAYDELRRLLRPRSAELCVQSIVATYESLRLCPLSYPWAMAAHRKAMRLPTSRRDASGYLLLAIAFLPWILLGPRLAMDRAPTQAGQGATHVHSAQAIAAFGATEKRRNALCATERQTASWGFGDESLAVAMGLGLITFAHTIPWLWLAIRSLRGGGRKRTMASMTDHSVEAHSSDDTREAAAADVSVTRIRVDTRRSVIAPDA